jgi:DNA polymerase-4
MDSPLRKIIHVDMDAFYASVEQRDDPALKGHPVAVGHAAARGVVAAASYEARKFGVRSAMPMQTALRNCPQLKVVRPRFEVYRAVSHQIREIFADYTALIEPVSLDEAYLDVTENRRGLATAAETAMEIRARIKAETGLTASAGISYNKFLAKLASDEKKPDGQFVIPPGRGEAFVAPLPVGRFHGIGPVTAKKMNRLGIFTGTDLKAQELAFLARHFGKAGSWYFAIARAEDDRRVSPDRQRKSSGSETTFQEDLTDPKAIEVAVTEMAEDVWRWCEKTKMFGRTVTVKVKYADFRQVTRSRTPGGPVNTHEALVSQALVLVRSVFPPEMGIRLVGVTASNFDEAEAPAADSGQLRFDLNAEQLVFEPAETQDVGAVGI